MSEDKKPREFWLAAYLDEDEIGNTDLFSDYFETDPEFECQEKIHVIEKSYADLLEHKVEILESRASQFESTIAETVKIRDSLERKLKICVEALEKIEYCCRLDDCASEREAAKALEKIKELDNA